MNTTLTRVTAMIFAAVTLAIAGMSHTLVQPPEYLQWEISCDDNARRPVEIYVASDFRDYYPEGDSVMNIYVLAMQPWNNLGLSIQLVAAGVDRRDTSSPRVMA